IELLELAVKNDVQELVLTDINNTSACLNFIQYASSYGVKPVVGIDFRNGAEQQFIGIAKNNEGFRELNTFLSKHSHIKKEIPERAPTFENAFIIYPFEKMMQQERTDFASHEFIGVSVEELRKLPFSRYRNLTDKLVIQQPVTIRNKKDFNAHRLLRAIDNNTLLSKLRETEQCNEGEKMLHIKDLLKAFEEFPQIIENTRELLEQCSIHFEFGKGRTSQNQKIFGESPEKDFAYLKQLCDEGLHRRYPQPSEKVKKRISIELEVIRKMDFTSYFLINHEIVSYAKRNQYPHVGRGSGANSIVAYLTGITDVDPIELDLYFERFINPYRSSPPDFDIDFSWKDREDVTRYIFERFPNVALLGTYVTFQFRAVVRELAKVFGLPKAEIDAFIKGNKQNQKNDHYFKLVTKYGKLIHGFPNYLSVHSGGIVITKNPVQSYCATFMPPKGFQTLQIDMHIAEAVGIFKF